MDSLLELRSEILARQAATGAKTAIVAEDTTTHGHRAVDVWAAESSIQTDLLHTLPKPLTQVEAVGEVAQPRFTPDGRIAMEGQMSLR